MSQEIENQSEPQDSEQTRFDIDDLVQASKDSNLEEWLKCNTFISSIKDVKQYLTKNEGSGYQTFQTHQKMFNISEFAWENVQDDVEDLRNLITMKDATVRIRNADDPKYLNWLYSNSRLYQEGFSINLIHEYVQRPNNLFGTPIYDKALRVQCDLLQVFLVFHLKSDFTYHKRIDGRKYKLVDPFTRINIRETNLADKNIKAKYFCKSFDLKKFVYELYQNYFPNVTWRYIGQGHFAHRITLQITEFLFQVGLFTFYDVDHILKLILEKSENLVVLENACLVDAKAKRIPESFIKDLSLLFSDMKYYISLIIIHCMVLVNDHSMKQSLSFTRESSVFSAKPENWNLAYFKSQQLNNIINNIMMKYLMKDSVISVDNGFDSANPDSMIYLDEDTKINLNDIFMMISDVDMDICFISKNLVTDELLSYRIGQAPVLSKKMEGRDFKLRAETICKTLRALHEDIINGKLGSFNDLRDPGNLNLEKAVKHVVDMIDAYFNTMPGIPNYYKQLAMNDYNAVGLLFYILKIQLDLDKVDSLKLVLNSLTLVCKDNFATQGQIFIHPHIEIFEELHKMYSLMGTIVTTEIFKQDNQILYSNPEIFDVIFRIYKQEFTANIDKYFNTKSSIDMPEYADDE
jgi:hypothetical protein